MLARTVEIITKLCYNETDKDREDTLMKKTTKIISHLFFNISYIVFLSLAMESLLQFLGCGFGVSVDSTKSNIELYPRFIPFCIAVGLFALLVLGLLAFFNIKHSEKLGYTKRLWIFQLVSVFVLSIPATEIWRMIFELLHKVFSK